MTTLAWALGGWLATCSALGSGPTSYQSDVANNAKRFGIPAEWIASVISIESGGRACRDGRPIRSDAGAMGVMQLMGPTWNQMRNLLNLGPSVDDPAANIAAGAAYLRLMYDRFGYPGLFAAYNAGPTRFSQSLSGRPLPLETRRYVAAVLARIEGRPDRGLRMLEPAQTSIFVIPGSDDGGVAKGVVPSGNGLFFLSRQ